jgi:hypothetical protein
VPATYLVEVLSRSSSALAVRCTITHPDVTELPLPGHRPTWARLLLLADGSREWESLGRDAIWELADRITHVELIALCEHPRVQASDRPSVTVQLTFDGAPPELPAHWEPWLTIGDDAAAKWSPATKPKSIPVLAQDGEAAASADELAQRVATLRELARAGSGDAVHALARGLNHGVIAADQRAAALRTVLDGLHLTGGRLSSFAWVADPSSEVVATYAVAAGQLRAPAVFSLLAVLGDAARSHAGPVLERLARARAATDAPPTSVARHFATPTPQELLARRQCLGDPAPIPARALADLALELAHQLPATASISSAWPAAEQAAFDRAIEKVRAQQAAARARAAKAPAKKKAGAKKAAKKK